MTRRRRSTSSNASNRWKSAKPGAVAKVFATHPMTVDRIQMAQKNITEILPNKPEYVVNTSEFNEMRGRMIAGIASRSGMWPIRRNLRYITRQVARKPIDGQQSSENDGDDRPTLQRRHDSAVNISAPVRNRFYPPGRY